MAYLSPIQFSDSNVAGTTLANVGGIGSGDNTLTLASAAVLGCPSLPSFDLLIDSEFITVNGISGNICTPLSRGANGSTPAAHAQNAPVYCPITIGMLTAAMARLDQANANGLIGLFLQASGINANVNVASRDIGTVAPGAGTPWTPTGGPYVGGDIVFDVSNATFYVCTVSGSPGTWITAPSLKLAQTFSAAITVAFAGILQTLNRIDGAAALMAHQQFQRAGSTKFGLGLDASDQFALLNAALNAINLGVTDLGILTARNALNVPPSAGGALAATSYGTVPVKFAETLLGSAAATVTFSSIPSTFRNLTWATYSRGDTAAVTIQMFMQLNNVTTATYDTEQANVIGANAVAGAEVLATASPNVATLPAATATANYFGASSGRLNMYAGATGNKIWTAESAEARSDLTGNQIRTVWMGKWRTVATAVNRVDFKCVTGNFVAASYWGIGLEP